MFCGLSSSRYGSSGIHKTMQSAIRAELGLAEVYELDSIEELAAFLANK
jgi:hypothetical protein